MVGDKTKSTLQSAFEWPAIRSLVRRMVDLVRKNWHQIIEEQMRWRELLYVEWNGHKGGCMVERLSTNPKQISFGYRLNHSMPTVRTV